MKYKSLSSIIRDVVKGVAEQKHYSSVESAIKNLMTTTKKADIEHDSGDQVVAGTYRTKHFEVCPKAQKYFTSFGKDVNSKFVEQSAIYHDQLFGLEKAVIAAEKSDGEDVKSAEETVHKIRTITDFYYEKQPDYLQDHIDKIKSYLGKEGKPFQGAPGEPTGKPDNDKDLDNTTFPISHTSKMQRKLKIIDND